MEPYPVKNEPHVALMPTRWKKEIRGGSFAETVVNSTRKVQTIISYRREQLLRHMAGRVGGLERHRCDLLRAWNCFARAEQRARKGLLPVNIFARFEPIRRWWRRRFLCSSNHFGSHLRSHLVCDSFRRSTCDEEATRLIRTHHSPHPKTCPHSFAPPRAPHLHLTPLPAQIPLPPPHPATHRPNFPLASVHQLALPTPLPRTSPHLPPLVVMEGLAKMML